MNEPLPTPVATGEMAVPRPGDAFVYRAYAADGCLLYVGVTGDVLARVGRHYQLRAPWVEIAVRITWAQYVNRAEAEEAETGLIRELNPQFNLSGNWHARDPECFHPTKEETKSLSERAEKQLREAIFDA